MVNTFPTCLVQGETFSAEFTLDAASLVVNLRGPSAQNITAALTDGVWRASADTTSWAAGVYSWEAWATLADTSKVLVTRQSLDLKASVLNGGSALSVYEQIVSAIEGFLASNGNDPTWKRYKINNREIERHSVDELLRLLAHYKRLAAMERRKQRGQSVLGPNIRFRF